MKISSRHDGIRVSVDSCFVDSCFSESQQIFGFRKLKETPWTFRIFESFLSVFCRKPAGESGASTRFGDNFHLFSTFVNFLNLIRLPLILPPENFRFWHRKNWRMPPKFDPNEIKIGAQETNNFLAKFPGFFFKIQIFFCIVNFCILVYLRCVGGEVGATSALAPKVGPLGLVRTFLKYY